MANRLILGRHAGVHKFRISRAGADVLSAGLGDLLVADLAGAGVVQNSATGIVGLGPAGGASDNAEVYYPNFGGTPRLFFRVSGDGAHYYYPTYKVNYRDQTASSVRFGNASAFPAIVHWFVWLAA